MDLVPHSLHDALMALYGALLPMLIQVIQAFLRALERKAESLARKHRDSDRPEAESRREMVKELGKSFHGRVIPEEFLRKIIEKQQKKNGNGGEH